MTWPRRSSPFPVPSFGGDQGSISTPFVLDRVEIDVSHKDLELGSVTVHVFTRDSGADPVMSAREPPFSVDRYR